MHSGDVGKTLALCTFKTLFKVRHKRTNAECTVCVCDEAVMVGDRAPGLLIEDGNVYSPNSVEIQAGGTNPAFLALDLKSGELRLEVDGQVFGLNGPDPDDI